MITLDFHNRENLYARVDERVEIMMSQGLEDEVRALYGKGLLVKSSTAAQAIGYKEIIDYIEGGTTLADAVELIKQYSRNYAKRQLTWFGRNKDINWIYPDDALDGTEPFEYVMRGAERILQEFGIAPITDIR